MGSCRSETWLFHTGNLFSPCLQWLEKTSQVETMWWKLIIRLDFTWSVHSDQSNEAEERRADGNENMEKKWSWIRPMWRAYGGCGEYVLEKRERVGIQFFIGIGEGSHFKFRGILQGRLSRKNSRGSFCEKDCPSGGQLPSLLPACQL